MALILNSDYISPAELTGYVREALKDRPINDLALIDDLLPDTLIDDVDFRANITQLGLRRAAKFRTFDTEAPQSARKGVARISGELPPISEKRILGEYDRLRLRKADNAILDIILNDGVELAEALKTRLIMAKAQALVTGKVSLAQDGLELEADFLRSAAHSVTAATLWSGAADPVLDQESWFTVFRILNSGNPARAITSQRVMSTLMRNTAIKAMCLAPGATQGIVTREQVNSLFTSFGHPPFEIFDAQVEDYNGNTVRLIPDDRILYIASNNAKLGETLWGVTAEAIESDYNVDATEAPGVVVGSYINPDPVQRWTKASGIGLPILGNSNATMIAKVL
ncbi:major capsid protein E [Rhodococcus sp. 15-2388-1-1a]|uniref:major capsid protein n=1 Tax=Rhodococcus sp. 15-2388-1-1a TaxID=2023142 RepID=UPI000B9A602E|nr:major capsid protein [Rhodococcus sp. 15-2388-1-1a]OZE90221.1 major capsid protein E [Rhodococcus sp. 15-2388-1-1a]